MIARITTWTLLLVWLYVFVSWAQVCLWLIDYLFHPIYQQSIVTALDCYVCKDQEDNKEKCVKTVKTCKSEQDRCLTEVRWEFMDAQYYVSKRCVTQDVCNKEIKDSYDSLKCHRIGYNDWACIDCCHGDRCNFFVTLSTTSLICSNFLLLVSFLLKIFAMNKLWSSTSFADEGVVSTFHFFPSIEKSKHYTKILKLKLNFCGSVKLSPRFPLIVQIKNFRFVRSRLGPGWT
jgi:hypothetical protein